MFLSAIIGVLISFALAAWLTSRFCDPASKFHILDHPNERSLHKNPTPRSGGIAIFAAIAAGVLWMSFSLAWPVEMIWLWASVLIVAVVSYIDDRSSVPVRYRFAAHLIAATVLIGAGFVLESLPLPGHAWPLPSWLAIAVLVPFIVWMINLYNFMDGMDGFAAGMTLIGFGTLAILGGYSGHTAFMLVSIVVASASAGFLLFNFPPARIFMGDVGSSSLGLLAAALSLWGARDGVFPFWVALLVFSPFIVDSTSTLLRRALRGEKVWQAHRRHYYQRLVQIGWGHRRTVLWEYALMLSASCSALWVVDKSVLVQWVILSFWIVLYAVLAVGVRQLEVRHQNHEKLA